MPLKVNPAAEGLTKLKRTLVKDFQDNEGEVLVVSSALEVPPMYFLPEECGIQTVITGGCSQLNLGITVKHKGQGFPSRCVGPGLFSAL